MITFDSVTKRYPDGTVAVDSLSMDLRAGEVTVLVGPSGCGKTTTLRLVNRMVEPTEGRVLIDGVDVARPPAHELRRDIGYVIQHTGLFPHRTVAGNIASVPRLLEWDKARTRDRVDDLLELVGLSPALRTRFPHQLSGGQRQRVGVARALAADPPVLLMDEPFGAVDPVVRSTLQDELLRLQDAVRKTIAFVTHDLDEALKLGDRVALFRDGGVLEQIDEPQDLLWAPRTPFVEEFLGEDRGLKRLGLIAVSDVAADPGPVVAPDDPAETARKVAHAHRTDWVVVVDSDRTLRGWAWVDDLAGRGCVADAPTHAPHLSIAAGDSLRNALHALLATRIGVAVRVGPGGTYEGILTQEILSRQVVPT